MAPIHQASEQDILRILERDGPRTGAELLEQTGMEPLALWRLCRRCAELRLETIGRRFLRLDRAVAGYARLSPSIRREFLTYTLLGRPADSAALAERAARLRQNIERISGYKLDLARQIMESVVSELPAADLIRSGAAFLVAGDITYGMGHDVPRPEPSTGKMVRGSDLDIIIVADDDLPDQAIQALDDAVYRKKHYLLVHPDYREEIDYIIKRMARVRQQLKFDTFESMVACKILCEGRHLYGSESLFREIKELTTQHGIPERLTRMEADAAEKRSLAEAHLLEIMEGQPDENCRNLFYTREEGDEIY